MKQIVIQNIEEDLACIDVCKQNIAFGGSLGICYIYDLSRDTILMLSGHFKKITCIQLSNQFCITASEDFSVRMWEVSKGIQCFIFLDINV